MYKIQHDSQFKNMYKIQHDSQCLKNVQKSTLFTVKIKDVQNSTLFNVYKKYKN